MPNGIGSRLKTGPSQTGQLPGRIKSELCDLSGLRIDLISRLLSLSRLYSGILHGSGASALETGKSEKEWTLETEGLAERSNCSRLPPIMVNWTNGMTGHGS